VVNDIQLQFLKDFSRYREWDNRNSSQPTVYPEFVKLQQLKPVEQLQAEYADYFCENDNAGSVDVRYVAHKPYDDNDLPLTNAFLSLIKNAEHSIYWGCHGIRPPRIVADYLAEAVERGVEVNLITNSQYSSQSLMVKGLLGWMYKECTKHYRGLLERGIKIWEWQLEGAFHSKNFLVDDQIVSIGSYNIARGSTYHHSESNIFVYNDQFAKEVRQQFEKDLEHCKPVWLDDVSNRLPQEDAYSRPLHERDLMIKREMITPEIQQELDKGEYIRILT